MLASRGGAVALAWSPASSRAVSVSRAVEQPLDHGSLRQMVLSSYTARESRNREREARLESVPERADELRPRRKAAA